MQKRTSGGKIREKVTNRLARITRNRKAERKSKSVGKRRAVGEVGRVGDAEELTGRR